VSFKKCICGEEIDVLRCGAVMLCDECLEQQSPIVKAWEKELRGLIKKYKDKGLLAEWMFRSFHFLSVRIFDAFNEPDEVYLKTGTFSSWLNEKRNRNGTVS